MKPGDTSGRWTILSIESNGLVRCRCTCGTVRSVKQRYIRYQMVRSCGCLQREAARKTGLAKRVHGEHKKTTEWFIWNDMLRRCRNHSDPAFKDYGGRGITVCERWLDYRNFLADVARRPSREYTIDRIDNDQGYKPGNVRWATRFEQGRNKRNNRMLTLKGETKTISEWTVITGLSFRAITYRLEAGLSVEQALTLPRDCGRKFKSLTP